MKPKFYDYHIKIRFFYIKYFVTKLMNKNKKKLILINCKQEICFFTSGSILKDIELIICSIKIKEIYIYIAMPFINISIDAGYQIKNNSYVSHYVLIWLLAPYYNNISWLVLFFVTKITNKIQCKMNYRVQQDVYCFFLLYY